MRRVGPEHELDWGSLRNVMISFGGTVSPTNPLLTAEACMTVIHGVMAQALHRLALQAGSSAPLSVIAHSLGTVIASNYLYDLSRPQLVSDEVKAHMDDVPLERGETLVHFFTLGSPLAVWALHHDDFGRPLTVPSTALLPTTPTSRGSG